MRHLEPPEEPDLTCPECGHESLDYDYEDHRLFCEADDCDYIKHLPRCGHCNTPLSNRPYQNRERGGLCSSCFEAEERAYVESGQYDLDLEAIGQQYAEDREGWMDR